MKKNATYYVTQPIRHDGQDYQVGDTITLTHAALAALQTAGAVSDTAPVDAEVSDSGDAEVVTPDHHPV